MAQQDFAERVVLVTGGASGIGRATVQTMTRRGAIVAIADTNSAVASEFVESLTAEGYQASSFTVDVSDEFSVEGLISDVVSTYGKLDCAVNCAGISERPVDMIDMSLDSWERMIRVNQTAIFLCLKHQVKYFLSREIEQRKGAAIVNVSSGAGLTPAPGQIHYTAAKHAVLGMTKYAAQEQINNNIRINAVCPGYIDTPMVAENVPQNVIDMLPKVLPQGRMGTPEEMASVITWLCSFEANWVNGQSIVVDGGQIFH
ncbi:MAG: SDR family NAD(P)-dependent oxidoreductase [Pseudomonadales bacterium]